MRFSISYRAHPFQAKTVPAWMFLGWLNQIIALLDSPSAVALHDIVQRLSEEYPQVL
jgi:DNA-dependent protein kinase catalytic subunit